MHNATMYCLCLHDKALPIMKKLNYVPVGLGNDKFSEEWLKDNTLENISYKNKYYGEYTFNYWFWKNILPKIEDKKPLVIEFSKRPKISSTSSHFVTL